MRRRKGRRWVMVELGPAYTDEVTGEQLWHWIAWRLFERVSGVAPETHAVRAIEHFLESEHTYTLASRSSTV